MSTRKINPLVQTEAINAALEKNGLKHKWVADKLGLEPHVFSLCKSGYREFPMECVGPFAEILGVPVDEVLRLFALDEVHA